LRSHAAILGEGFESLVSAFGLPQTLSEHRNRDLVLMDTPGYGPKEMEETAELAPGMASVPEWAPTDEDHLLGSTSVIRSIRYGEREISYVTFDPRSREVLRLRRPPQSVRAGSASLSASPSACPTSRHRSTASRGSARASTRSPPSPPRRRRHSASVNTRRRWRGRAARAQRAAAGAPRRCLIFTPAMRRTRRREPCPVKVCRAWLPPLRALPSPRDRPGWVPRPASIPAIGPSPALDWAFHSPTMPQGEKRNSDPLE